MVVQLTVEQENRLDQIIARGDYDAAGAIDEAIRLLAERAEELAWLRAELDLGEEDERQGRLIRHTPGFIQRLVRESEERSRLGLPIKDAVKPPQSS